MSTKPLKKIIKEYFKGTNFNEINKTITVEKTWNKTVGNPIKKQTQLTSFTNGTIYIKTKSPIWRNELSLQKNMLLKKIQKQLPALLIKNIIFK